MITRLAETGASLGGRALGVVFRLAGELPHRDKPLHPRGQVVRAVMDRHGLDAPTGIELVDAVRRDDVLARESRSVGLPSGLPDISGLAVRITERDGRHGDLLFATTGWGRVTRYVLTTSRSVYGRPMTTLFPYRSDAGRILLGLRESGPGRLDLACAIDGGPWRVFGSLELGEPVGDQDVSFDPVLNVPSGLQQYGVVRRLREPAYSGARDSRE